MQRVTVDNSPNEEDRTTAVGLARYADDYLHAAMIVETNDPKPSHISPVPAYFLALHGIELTLNAFLRHKGVSVRDLQRKFGHDLHACHRKAKELGLNDVFKEHPVHQTEAKERSDQPQHLDHERQRDQAQVRRGVQ